MEISQKQAKTQPAQPPIYPFYIKFASHKQKKQSFSNPHPYSSVSTQPFPDDDDSDEQQYYQESFQSYNQQNYEESICQEQQEIEQSELQNKIEDEIVTVKNVSDISGEEDTSLDFLRRANEKLIRLKEEYRAIATKYKYNLDILHRQRQELQLRNLRDKAIDCDYQFHISQEYERDRAYSYSIVTSINKEASLIKKSKYRRLKEQKSLNDPSDSCCILSNSRILDSKAIDVFSLVKKREEVLNKRRQQQMNKAKLVILQRKQSEYRKMMDVFDNYCIKGNQSNKEKRAQLLREEIQLKQNMFHTKQTGIKLDISSMKKEILTITTKISVYEDQIQSIAKDKQQETSNPKFNSFGDQKITKKIKSTPSDIKLDKIQTPKSKIKIAFNGMGTPLSKQKFSKLFKPNSHLYYRQHTTQD